MLKRVTPALADAMVLVTHHVNNIHSRGIGRAPESLIDRRTYDAPPTNEELFIKTVCDGEADRRERSSIV